jgi:predicted MFS family arabinose efflux permease
MLGVVAYLGYLTLDGFYPLIAASLISGLGRAIWEPVTKSLFARAPSGADTAFRVRYIAICVSGIAGPSICAFLSNYSDYAYQMASAVLAYALVAVLMFWLGPDIRESGLNPSANAKTGKGDRRNLPDVIGIVSLRFISVIVGGTLVYMAFSQFESIFPLFLNEYFDDAVKIFSALLILNSAVSAFLQMLYMFISRKIKKTVSNKLIILSGNIAFMTAFALFAVGSSIFHVYVVAICIYSIGEVLVIPATDVAVDEIAPEDKKSLYFGVAEIRSLGFTAGPILAGAILQTASPSDMCAVSILIFAASTIFFLIF